MPIQSFQDLRDYLIQDARDALHAIRLSRPGEKLYAFAISTDDDAIAPRAIGNTEEALAQKLAQRDDDPKLRPYIEYGFRWVPDEWPAVYFEGGPRPPQRTPDTAEFFEQITAFMHAWTSLPGNTHKKFRAAVFRAMVDALHALDKEGLFGRGKQREEVTLFIGLSDSDDDYFLVIESTKLLNSRRAASRLRRGVPFFQRCLITLIYYALWLKRGRLIARSLPPSPM
jgi:hypothetical protein